MKSVVKMLAAVGLCAAAAIPALADPGTKVALVPGGPHPYFAAWEQAGMDAMKDLGLGAARLQSTLPAESELPARIQPYLDSRPSAAAAAAADYDGAVAPFVHVYEDAGTEAPLALGRAPGSRVVYDSDGITVTTSS